MKNIPNKLEQSKVLGFLCDLSNIQKCNFKDCPLTWVALLTMILPLLCNLLKKLNKIQAIINENCKMISNFFKEEKIHEEQMFPKHFGAKPFPKAT
jgi:hypothetical protein